MAKISDDEIKEIVQRVVGQSMGVRATFTTSNKTTSAQPVPSPAVQAETPAATTGPIAIGADHGGFPLKELLKKHLSEKGYEVIDCGTNDQTSVDYPDFAKIVAEKVAVGTAWRGIMIDGAGIGSCMTANKVPGVRAAMCYDYTTAVNSREHNNANLLTLGAGLIGTNQAKLIVDTWLNTEFAGGRHLPRIEKITQVEKQYSKGSK